MEGMVGVRSRILASALNLFAQQGFSETSVDEITTHAGVTKGAFYYYFRSKDEVLELLHDQFLDYELTMARKVHRANGLPPEKLRRMVHDLISSILLYRPNVMVFFQEVDRLPAERRLDIEKRRRVYQGYMEDILRQGVEAGYFRSDLDPLIATLGIFGLCNYTYRWLRPEGRLSVDEVIEKLSEMILGGVLRADTLSGAPKSLEALPSDDVG